MFYLFMVTFSVGASMKQDGSGWMGGWRRTLLMTNIITASYSSQCAHDLCYLTTAECVCVC